MPEVQQGVLIWPQLRHMPSRHWSDEEEQPENPQHGPLERPHCRHRPAAHPSDEEKHGVPLVQHGPPRSPQRLHFPEEHTSNGSAHRLPGQHGSLELPQIVGCPDAATPISIRAVASEYSKQVWVFTAAWPMAPPFCAEYDSATSVDALVSRDALPTQGHTMAGRATHGQCHAAVLARVQSVLTMPERKHTSHIRGAGNAATGPVSFLLPDRNIRAG